MTQEPHKETDSPPGTDPTKSDGNSHPESGGESAAVTRFVRYAWFVVAYMAAIILWGAWVRITHSGAGCGDHWPTCNGDVVPFSPSTETLIEYTHRLTSGLSLPLVIVLIIWAFRRFPRAHRVRKASLFTLFFLLTEAAVGAGLVKFELVADNASMVRALTASFHLVNTFVLTACAGLTAWWAAGGEMPESWRRDKRILWIGVLLALLLISSMTGAVTALGDTLFPKTEFNDNGLIAHISEDLSASQHFLVRLRIVHPIIAVGTALFAVVYTSLLRMEGAIGRVRFWSSVVTIVVLAQTALGVLNILLKAPGWIQLIHLLVALTLWLSAVFLLFSALARPHELGEVEDSTTPAADDGPDESAAATAQP